MRRPFRQNDRPAQRMKPHGGPLAAMFRDSTPPPIESRFALRFAEYETSDPGLVLGADGNVYLVAPDGSRTQVSGSLPIESVRFPLAYDTPNLVGDGVQVYAPSVGDIILGTASFMSITTAWDGDSPTLYLGDQSTEDTIASINLGSADTPVGGADSMTDAAFQPGGMETVTIIDPTTTVYAVASDSGSTQGAGVLVLFILKAS